MPSFLIGSSYAISAGLIIYAIQFKYAPDGSQFTLIVVWAAIGVILAAMSIWRSRGRKE
jgi:hypothetical protein